MQNKITADQIHRSGNKRKKKLSQAKTTRFELSPQSRDQINIPIETSPQISIKLAAFKGKERNKLIWQHAPIKRDEMLNNFMGKKGQHLRNKSTSQ